MKRKPGISSSEDPRAIRLAWAASFLATLALVVGLGVVRSAQALTLSNPGNGSGGSGLAAALPDDEGEFESADEEEEDESESEECEAGEDEEAEEECEAVDEEDEALSECVFASASATVSASSASNTVRLAIRYTAFAPSSVAVSYWLRGSKGPLSLGSDREHLAPKGVLRETEKLSDAQMGKALAARSFTVELRPAHAPRYCHGQLDRHLTVRHVSGNQLTWSDREKAGFRASRPR